MNNIILAMTLSGSLVVAVYYMSVLFAKKYLSPCFRYHLLKIAMMFYLLPFQELKYLLPQHTAWEISPLKNFTSKDFIENYFVVYNHKVYHIDILAKIAFLCIVLLLLFTVAYIVWYMIRYFQKRKMVVSSLENTTTSKQEAIFEKVTRELGLKRNIRFAFSENCSTPFTFGFFSPSVIFPCPMRECSEEEWEFVVRHELNHIKSKDIFIGFLSIVVVVLHFFNPIAHLLRYEINNMCEIQCDYKTIEKYSVEKRNRYGKCVIMMAANSTRVLIPGSVRFLGHKLSYHKMKRRILEMKEIKKKNKKFLSVLASLAVVVVGSTTVWAYEPAIKIEILDPLPPNGHFSVCEPQSDPMEIESNSGNVFKDKNGNQYEISNQQKSICFHKYVDVLLQYHILNSDGGCTTNYYDAKRCTKCGNIIEKEYSYEIIYKKCPH